MTYGHVTASMVGVAMKEAVRRAIREIRRQRFIFEAQAKVSYAGENTDLVTSADHEAQAIYLKVLRNCFPDHGIIAEENELRLACSPGRKRFFTLDPLDGTKAFGRRQSTGVGTMIAMVEEGEVVAAYVGDVMTQEIYGFRPESEVVHRISEFESAEVMTIADRPLSTGVLLSRNAPWEYGWDVPGFVRSHFKDLDVEGGSIGISFARLWKQEVAALMTGPAYETPWDSTPLIGISYKLGFVFLRFEQGRFEVVDMQPPEEVEHRDHDLLVVHRQHLDAILALTDL